MSLSEYNYGLSLSLVLYGLKCHPQRATDILGIDPTSSRAVGEGGVIKGTAAQITLTPSKKNIWVFCTGRVDDSEFDEHWEILYQKIKGKEASFAKLSAHLDCIALSINIGVGKFIPGIEIHPNVTSVISKFGLRLDFDVVW